MSDAAERNVYRLQGTLERITRGLRQARSNLVRALVCQIEDEEIVKKLPSVVQLDKILNKPLGDVTRHELIAMWLDKGDLEAVTQLLDDLEKGNFTYLNDYDGNVRRIGALRKLLEG